MSEYDISIGQALQKELCETCRKKLNERLTMADIWKGARNFNHLLKIFKNTLCDDCLNKIMERAQNAS